MVIKGARPSKRRAHSGAVATKHLIIFGGKEGATKLSVKDLWTLDLEHWTWEQHDNVKFPGSARKGHTATMLGNKMYIFGGRSSNTDYFGDLFALRLDSDTGKPVSWDEVPLAKDAKRPSDRNHHVAAAMNGKQMVIYGGRSGHDYSFPLLTDLWLFDSERITWTEVKPLADPRLPVMMGYPHARIESATASVSPDSVAIAGGRDWQGKVLNDAWTLRISAKDLKAEWTSVSPINCASENISTTASLVSAGFFVGLAVIMAVYLFLRQRSTSRRAPYEPISGRS
jgi:N-acetylneuraminic acid mutarotase